MLQQIKNFIVKHWPLIILAGLTVFYFRYQIFNNFLPYSGDLGGSDLIDINYSLKHLYAESLKAHQVPLWTHLLSNGMPFLAESEAGVFYPINLLLYSILPTLTAFNLSFILHFFLGALFTYLYLRKIKLGQFAATLGAIIFVFSGFFVCHLKHVNVIDAAIWLPLIFYLTELYFEKLKFNKLLWIGIFLAIQFLAGMGQISYYTLMAFSLYYVFKGLVFIKANQQLKLYKLLIKLFWQYGLIIIIFLALSVIQLLPTLELMNYTWRNGGLVFSDSIISSLHPRNLLLFIFPFLYGNPAYNSYLTGQAVEQINVFGMYWEICGYIGLLTVILSFLGLISYFFYHSYKKYILFFLILLISGWFFALGGFNPFFPYLWKIIPWFKNFRSVGRFVLLMIFSLTVLAAMGSQLLTDYLKQQRKLKSVVIQKFIKVLIFIFIVADLFLFGFAYNKMNFKSQKFLAIPESAKYLKTDQDLYRLYSFAYPFSWNLARDMNMGWQGTEDLFVINRNILNPNINLIYNLSSIEEISALNSRRNLKLLNRFIKWGVTPVLEKIDFPKQRKITVDDNFLNVLSFQNVKYVLSFFELENSNLILDKQIDFDTKFLPLNIYQNKKVLPRAFLAKTAEYVPDEELVLKKLAVKDYNPQEKIFIENGRAKKQPTYKTGQLEILSYQPTAIEIKVSLDGAGFLFINNTYYPGWQAWVDDQLTEILLANFNFQAIKLTAGEHKIVFKYLSKSYQTGKIITLVTLIILVSYAIIYLIISPKNKYN